MKKLLLLTALLAATHAHAEPIEWVCVNAETARMTCYKSFQEAMDDSNRINANAKQHVIYADNKANPESATYTTADRDRLTAAIANFNQ